MQDGNAAQSTNPVARAERTEREDANAPVGAPLALDSGQAHDTALAQLHDRLTERAGRDQGGLDCDRLAAALEIGQLVLGLAEARDLGPAERSAFIAALEYTSLGEVIGDCLDGIRERR